MKKNLLAIILLFPLLTLAQDAVKKGDVIVHITPPVQASTLEQNSMASVCACERISL